MTKTTTPLETMWEERLLAFEALGELVLSGRFPGKALREELLAANVVTIDILDNAVRSGKWPSRLLEDIELREGWATSLFEATRHRRDMRREEYLVHTLKYGVNGLPPGAVPVTLPPTPGVGMKCLERLAASGWLPLAVREKTIHPAIAHMRQKAREAIEGGEKPRHVAARMRKDARGVLLHLLVSGILRAAKNLILFDRVAALLRQL